MFAKHLTAGHSMFLLSTHVYIRASIWMECTYIAMQQPDAMWLPQQGV